jgi:hypothetical protein
MTPAKHRKNIFGHAERGSALTRSDTTLWEAATIQTASIRARVRQEITMRALVG